MLQKLASILFQGKRLCSDCFNALPVKERDEKTIPIYRSTEDVNCATKCQSCGKTCYYFYGMNLSKFGLDP